MGGGASGSGGAAGRAATAQELHEERLREYQELAARAEADASESKHVTLQQLLQQLVTVIQSDTMML